MTVSPFAISRTEITNAQFREFVEETGYVTSVEKPLDPADYPGVPEELLQPGSMVFAQPAGAVDMGDIGNWWRYVAGANWQHPTGPESNIDGLDDHPVTQVSIEDARAYAKWVGGRLATEAEWEFAARGGLSRKAYVWGIVMIRPKAGKPIAGKASSRRTIWPMTVITQRHLSGNFRQMGMVFTTWPEMSGNMSMIGGCPAIPPVPRRTQAARL